VRIPAWPFSTTGRHCDRPDPRLIPATASGGTALEEVWQPADHQDAGHGGFDHSFGTTIAILDDNDADAVPHTVIALGHRVPRRRLIAAANRSLRTYWSWRNVLDDPSPGAGDALPALYDGYVVLLRALTGRSPALYEAEPTEWTFRPVFVDRPVPGAIPVTVLDLRTALESAPRLQARIQHLEQQVEQLHDQADPWSVCARPHVVCLTGPAYLRDHIEQAALDETAAGHIVLPAHRCAECSRESGMDLLQWDRIKLADELVVVTDGLQPLAEGLLFEVRLAETSGTPVRLLIAADLS
jgi:hypothetical protein